MHARRFLVRLGILVAPLIAALAMTVTPGASAATMILIDSTTTASGCGDYSGDSALTNPVTAIGNAPDSSTIVICPGTYTLSNKISITGKDKITIKAALPIAGSRPTLKVAAGQAQIFEVSNSTNITLDGLILDGKTPTVNPYQAILFWGKSMTVKNCVLIGPPTGDSNGISTGSANTGPLNSLTITNSHFAGYSQAALNANGALKLAVTSSLFDASDGGRVTPMIPVGIRVNGYTDEAYGTGKISKSTFVNNNFAITVLGASKLNITDNFMADNLHGIVFYGYANKPGTDTVKVTGNRIVGVDFEAVNIQNNDAANVSITKITISKNILASNQFADSGVEGIRIESNVNAHTAITGKISGNMLMGFDPAGFIVLNTSGVTVSNDNVIMP